MTKFGQGVRMACYPNGFLLICSELLGSPVGCSVLPGEGDGEGGGGAVPLPLQPERRARAYVMRVTAH